MKGLCAGYGAVLESPDLERLPELRADIVVEGFVRRAEQGDINPHPTRDKRIFPSLCSGVPAGISNPLFVNPIARNTDGHDALNGRPFENVAVKRFWKGFYPQSFHCDGSRPTVGGGGWARLVLRNGASISALRLTYLLIRALWRTGRIYGRRFRDHDRLGRGKQKPKREHDQGRRNQSVG